MTGKKCEVCGREIENPTNRQRFCKECAKKRQAEAFHRYIWRTASIMPNGARNSPPAENRAALRSCWQGSRGRSNHQSTRLNR